MSKRYRIDSMNYIAGDELFTQKMPTHNPVEKLNLRFNVNYDTGGAGSVLRDAVATQLIDNIRVGAGTKWPIKVYGRDIHHVHAWLNRNNPSRTDFTAGAGVGKVADMQFTLPVGINPRDIPGVSIQVEYGNAGLIGADQTVNSAVVNGSFKFAEASQRVPNYKIIPKTNIQNVTGTQHIDLPPEGRLNSILTILRNSATPFARADLIDDLQVRVEGDEVLEADWEDMKTVYQDITDEPYIDGVGVIVLDDKPMIGLNSRMEFQLTALTNATFYLIYEPPTAPPKKPTVSRQVAPRTRGGFRSRKGPGKGLSARPFGM